MKLSRAETRQLGALFDTLQLRYLDLDCIATTTDDGRPYILLSQPDDARGGAAAFFIQREEWTNGWEVVSHHCGKQLAMDPVSLAECLVRARVAVLESFSRRLHRVMKGVMA